MHKESCIYKHLLCCLTISLIKVQYSTGCQRMIAPSWLERLHNREKNSVSTCSTIYCGSFYTILISSVASIGITDRLQPGRVGSRKVSLRAPFLGAQLRCVSPSFFSWTGFLEIPRASSPLHPSWWSPDFRKHSNQMNYRATRHF